MLFFAPSVIHAQQNPHFTQYMFSGLVINPAYAGVDEALSAMVIDRRQWTGLEGAPKTQTLSVHTLTAKRKVGLGLLVVNDKIGIHRNLTIHGSYAYHLKVASHSFLSFGLQAGAFNMRSDYGSIQNGTPDPKLNNATINELFFEVGAGLYFRSKRFHWGISAPELLPKTTPLNETESIQLRNVNLFSFLKYRFTLSPAWEFEPALLIKYANDLPLSADGAITFLYKDILTAGVSYRWDASLGYLMKLRITPQLQFGYAYDFPMGSLNQLSNGSHELMVQYLFRYERSGIKSPRL
ncbi:MAG: type IX secretion system membrane protein PorP/SprF [Cyclobacteriaceae bacterium]|nr:type IX secretion system membrane protein PorP/SprF [Cyclobacteriaceae bacterium]UYN86072.1 MAG: type IX secretion system membrane protein PorP/SprF [Cyclobacteriaceae bacterium]